MSIVYIPASGDDFVEEPDRLHAEINGTIHDALGVDLTPASAFRLGITLGALCFQMGWTLPEAFDHARTEIPRDFGEQTREPLAALTTAVSVTA
jgi:hypothetical protein